MGGAAEVAAICLNSKVNVKVTSVEVDAEADLTEVLPGVWRWADPGGSDRCGTAFKTEDGLALVDPPALSGADRSLLEDASGPVRFVLLTSARYGALAAPFQGAIVSVAGRDQLPGGLLAVALPEDPAFGDEAALLTLRPEGALLLTGDVLPFVGPTPVYYEGEAPPVAVFLDAIRTLLAAEPQLIAPSRQAPVDRQVIWSTGYAAHIGNRTHQQRAAPVEGPRFLVLQAQRVLEETLVSPVVVRQSPDGEWVPDPFACARCGRENEPMRQTCGGPPIARLCARCRAEERERFGATRKAGTLDAVGTVGVLGTTAAGPIGVMEATTPLPAVRMMVCAGGCCTREGARAVMSAARQALAAKGLERTVDVVPVSCLGECSIGPFLRVATSRGEEPAVVQAYRERTVERAHRFALAEGEVVDGETELVLSRFAAQVQPREVERLVERLAPALTQ